MELKRLKRFYNRWTNSVLRFNPLFQRMNPISEKMEMIGVCWDTDVLDEYWNNNGLKKGSMVIVKYPSETVTKTYKGEPLFELKEVIVDWFDFINVNHISHKRHKNFYQWGNCGNLKIV